LQAAKLNPFLFPAAAGDHHLNARESSSCAYETERKSLATAQITTQKFITVSDHSN